MYFQLIVLGIFIAIVFIDRYVKTQSLLNILLKYKERTTIEQIKEAIKNHADIHAKDKKGNSVLVLASLFASDPKIVEKILDLTLDSVGEEKYPESEEDWVAVFEAAKKNHNPEIITQLLKAGLNINFKIKDSFNPLNRLPPKIHPSKISAAESKIDLNIKILKLTYLKVTEPDVVKQLLDIDPKIFDQQNWDDVLKIASKKAESFLVEPLLLVFNCINDSLLDAVRLNLNPEVVESLLSSGANPNTSKLYSDGSISALMFAVRRNPITTKLLLEAGAAVDECEKDLEDGSNYEREWTALMEAVVNDAELETIKLLVKSCTDIDLKDEDGFTALTLETLKEDIDGEIVRFLIDSGADVNAMTDENNTPLIFANYDKANFEVTKMLVEAGADVNAQNEEGATPLILASEAYEGNPLIVKFLIDAGAKIDAEDENGLTALMRAAKSSANSTIVRLLIKEGADVSQRCKAGKTASDYAKINKKLIINTFDELFKIG